MLCTNKKELFHNVQIMITRFLRDVYTIRVNSVHVQYKVILISKNRYKIILVHSRAEQFCEIASIVQ